MNEETKPEAGLGTSHLTKIIAVLVEQNEQLRRENELLKIGIGLSRQGLSDEEIENALRNIAKSYADFGNGFPTDTMSHAKIGMGQGDGSLSHDKTGVGFPDGTKSDDKTGMGLPTYWKSYAKTGVGQGNDGKPYPNIGVGQTAGGKPDPKTGIGQTEVLEPLPPTVNADVLLVMHLANRLKASGVKYMPYKTLKNVATVMIHFYNKGDGSYPELKKLTKLSTGGMSKFMTAIRKRGLVRRYAYKKFELTPHGLSLLQQAYNKVKKPQ